MMKFPFLLPCAALLFVAGCNSPKEDTTSPQSSTGGSTSGGSTSGSSGSGNSASGNAASGKARLSIAVIPMGTTHVYWKSVEAGARKAGKEMDVDIQWKGPLKESDRAGQIGIVEQFVSEGTSAIVLAPLDNAALVKPVRSAADKKIPVVIIDSPLKGEPGKDYASLVATDNEKGGSLAGERMVKLLGGKGKVVMLRYAEGAASTHAREEGFLSVVKKAPGITIISDNRYAGATAGEAKDSAMNMVDKLQEADGIYSPNESSTLGMLLALRQSGLAGKKKFVGFDTSPQLIEGLKKGEINALIAQNPTKMGYEGVKTAIAAVRGEKFPTKIDTGVVVIDKDNLETAPIKTLLG